MQFLVTGSRTFKDIAVVNSVFDGIEASLLLESITIDVTVMDGASYGLDELAHKVAVRKRWRPRRIPARWSNPCRLECNHSGRRVNTRGREYCPAQGNYRNQRMVDIGGHLFCIGFFADKIDSNSGTYDCLTRAVKAGIPSFMVAKYPEWDIFTFPEGKQIGNST